MEPLRHALKREGTVVDELALWLFNAGDFRIIETRLSPARKSKTRGYFLTEMLAQKTFTSIMDHDHSWKEKGEITPAL